MADGDPTASTDETRSGARRRHSGSLISMRPLPLSFVRGKPPLRGWRKWVHIWRYGMHHPDEDLLGVIDAAADSLITQIMSAEAVLTGSRLDRLAEIRAELDAELGDDVPELAVLLGIEAKINALYPPAVQRRRAWMIRERFLRVAAGNATDYWAADRTETDLAQDHEDRIRRSDAAVAEAAARQAAAAAGAAEAEQALQEAQAAYDSARGAVEGEEAAVAADVEQLKEMRAAGAAEDDAERAALEPRVGALLDADAARESAAAAHQAAADEQERADGALQAARLDRDLVNARCELERAQARLRGTEQAVRDGRDSSGAAAGLTSVEAARGEVAAAQTRADAAAAAVAANAASAPSPTADAAAEAADPGDEQEPDAAAAAVDAGGEGDGGGGGDGGDGGVGGAGGNGGGGAPPSGIPVDADAQTLLGYIHSSYLMGIAREKAVRDLMRWLMMRFWTANAILVFALTIVTLVLEFSTSFSNLTAMVFGLFVVAAIGRVGATMSVVQRLQHAVAGNVLARDPILELTRLRTGKNGINLALFSGAVFALLMYALFASGMPAMLGFDDGIAPALSRVQDDERTEARNSAIAAAAERVGAAEAQVRVAEQRLRDAGADPETPGAAGEGRTGTQPGSAGTDAATGDGDEETNGVATVDAGTTAATASGADSGDAGEGDASPADGGAPIEELRENLTAARAELAQATAHLNALAAGSHRDAQARGEAAPGGDGADQEPADDPASAPQPAPPSPQPPAGGDGKPAAAPADPNRTGLLQRLSDWIFGPPGPEKSEAGPQCKATDACDPFRQLADALGFAGRQDFFKLLIWAFIAGFAERLVPDVLDNLANRARRRRRTGSDAAEEEAG